jgi:hypothetical protein
VGINLLNDFNYNAIHTTDNWTHFVKSIKELPTTERWKLVNDDTAALLSSEALYNTYKYHPDIKHTSNAVMFPNIDDIFKIAHFRMTTINAAEMPLFFGSPILVNKSRSHEFAVDCVFVNNMSTELKKSHYGKWQIHFIPWKQVEHAKGLLMAKSDCQNIWIAFIKTKSVLDMLEAKRISYDRELLTSFPDIVKEHYMGVL